MRVAPLKTGLILSILDEDLSLEAVNPMDGALVISAQVGNLLRRMMINNGSSKDALHNHAYNWINLEGRILDITDHPALW